MPDTIADRPQSAASLVKTFLETMERRDLAGAKAFLAPGFRMNFPGGEVFETLEALIAWAAPRYRWAKKRFDRFDVAAGPDGTAVYCFGTLYGEWPDGRTFDGIRFIDRFTVAGGKLIDQNVWNDLAERREREKGTPR